MTEEPIYPQTPEPEPVPSEPTTLPPDMGYEPTPPASKDSTKTILIVLAVVAGLSLLCCCVTFVILSLLGGPIEEIFEEVSEQVGSGLLLYLA